MLAGLTLSFQQFTALTLQFSRPKLERTVFSIQLAAQRYEVVDFFFQRLNQIFGHGHYTA